MQFYTLTGIADAALLSAPHIIPWNDRPRDAERLDCHNDGPPEFSSALSEIAHSNLQWERSIQLIFKYGLPGIVLAAS